MAEFQWLPEPRQPRNKDTDQLEVVNSRLLCSVSKSWKEVENLDFPHTNFSFTNDRVYFNFFEVLYELNKNVSSRLSSVWRHCPHPPT